MASSAHHSASLSLRTVAGPFATELSMSPPGPLMIGRRPSHDLVLPDPASRDHATLVDEQGTWYIMDTRSRHGTRVNGVRLEPQRKYPLQVGDLIEIQPFTFELFDPEAQRLDRSIVQTIDDGSNGGSTIAMLAHTHSRSQEQLNLLLDCAARIHSAADQHSLAEAVLDAAVAGTGFSNAAFLGPMAADGAIPVHGQRGAVAGSNVPALSRSLIRQASKGQPARLSRSQAMSQPPHGASIVSLGIDEALCVPILLEKTLAGFLYLDSRGEHTDRVSGEAADFAVGIGQLTAMAMANLKRLDLQRRYAAVQVELAAAAEAQRWILPTRKQCFGPFLYIGESRPGRLVSGDFFDVVPLDDHRLAVSLGDVTGKGIAASVLMTAAQGFFHSALIGHGDVGRAVRDLNTFVCRRCGDAQFVTLWSAVLDAKEQSITYVDAGHGYAMLLSPDRANVSLDAAGGPPIGIDATHVYASAEAALQPGDRVLVVSDGLVEQPTAGTRHPKESRSDLFRMDRVEQTIQTLTTGADEVAALFDAVSAHAGGQPLADDATALLVRLVGPAGEKIKP